MEAKGQAELIDGWLTEHNVDWMSLDRRCKKRLLNQLQNCVDNIHKAHERAATVIAEAKSFSSKGRFQDETSSSY